MSSSVQDPVTNPVLQALIMQALRELGGSREQLDNLTAQVLRNVQLGLSVSAPSQLSVQPHPAFSSTQNQDGRHVQSIDTQSRNSQHVANELAPDSRGSGANTVSPAMARLPGSARLNTAALRQAGHNVNQARMTSAANSNPQRGHRSDSGGGFQNEERSTTNSTARSRQNATPSVPTLGPPPTAPPPASRHKITFVLYPPPPLNSKNSRQVVLNYRFSEFLERQKTLDLIHTSEFEGTTSIKDCFEWYFNKLSDSQFNYRFKSVPSIIAGADAEFPNDSLPVHLLVVSNSGRRCRDGNTYFQKFYVPDNVTNVGQLCALREINNKSTTLRVFRYADGLVLHVQPKSTPFGPLMHGRRHNSCFRRRFSHYLNDDSDAEKHEVQKKRRDGVHIPHYLDRHADLTSDEDDPDEGDSDREEEGFWINHSAQDQMAGEQSNYEVDIAGSNREISLIFAPTIASGSNVNRSHRAQVSGQYGADVFNHQNPLPVLPSAAPLRLWSMPFTPKPIDIELAPHPTVQDWKAGIISILAPKRESVSNMLSLSVSFDEVDRSRPDVSLTDALGEKLVCEIEKALAQNDFTHFFAKEGVIFGIEYSADGISLGEGIKVETLTRLCSRIFNDEAYFVPRRGDQRTIAVQSDPELDGLVASTRLLRFKVLGAVVGLHLVWHGVLADAVSPFLIQYMTNDCDINSITESFLKHHDSESLEDIMAWRHLGPQGSIMSSSRVMQYCLSHSNVGPAVHRERTKAYHDAYERVMLTNLLFGKNISESSELRAFKRGFDLPCDEGQPLTKLMHGYRLKGVESLIDDALDNVIDCADTLAKHMKVDSELGLEQILEEYVPRATLNRIYVDPFEQLIMDYLRGVGAPFPEALETLKSLPGVPLLDDHIINDPAFRSRTLYRAATGSDRLLPGVKLLINIVSSGFEYHSDEKVRKIMYENKVFSYKMCSATVYVPGDAFVNYLKDYRSHTKEALQDLHTWIFLQTVGCAHVRTMA
ncbi:hypothetical protein FRC02_002296 [Tulasnella sp. 418]|nr:hypothetical protein FRC02_002296 [Tulasnella sp. 418]